MIKVLLIVTNQKISQVVICFAVTIYSDFLGFFFETNEIVLAKQLISKVNKCFM